VTKFCDLTFYEFATQLGLKKSVLPAHVQTTTILPTANIPEEFDWRAKDAITPVKNQVSLIL